MQLTLEFEKGRTKERKRKETKLDLSVAKSQLLGIVTASLIHQVLYWKQSIFFPWSKSFSKTFLEIDFESGACHTTGE